MFVGIGVGIGRNRFAQGIFNAYNLRVVADGGITEAGNCVDAVSSLLQSASFLLIPSGYKGGKLYSEIPTNGNGDLTWTRGSDAFRTNASGVLQRVPWNLLQRSEEFDNAIWTKTGCSITTNTTTAPNGTTTADKLVSTNLATGCSVYQQGTIIANATYTFSIYVKASGANWIQLIATGTTISSPARLWVDLSNGALGTNNGGFSIASLTNVGDGWYRVSGSFTMSSTATFSNLFCALATGDNINGFNGDGTSGLYIWGAQLVEGTTAQTYLPTTDRLNFPRLDYTYGSCPSALLEPQRTNLALYSEQFDNSAWQKSNVTVTANTTTSPDGNTTADTISITSNNGYIRLFPLTFANSTTYTCSVFVKNNGISAGQTFNFYATNNLSSPNAAMANAIIDINNGSVTTSSSGSGVSAVSASISSLTNGWYRVQLTFTVGASAGGSICEIGFLASTATRTFFAWGAQLEAGAYPTTYIPTTSATATRVADLFSRSNIYTNGLITSSGGTWFVELRNNVAYVRDGVSRFGIGDTSAININSLHIGSLSSTTTRQQIYKTVAGSYFLLYTTLTDTVKIAIKWNGSTADVFVNGTKVVSATSFTTTNMELLKDSGGLTAPTFIQQMALFPTPLSDTDCAAITSL